MLHIVFPALHKFLCKTSKASSILKVTYFIIRTQTEDLWMFQHDWWGRWDWEFHLNCLCQLQWRRPETGHDSRTGEGQKTFFIYYFLTLDNTSINGRVWFVIPKDFSFKPLCVRDGLKMDTRFHPFFVWHPPNPKANQILSIYWYAVFPFLQYISGDLYLLFIYFYFLVFKSIFLIHYK